MAKNTNKRKRLGLNDRGKLRGVYWTMIRRCYEPEHKNKQWKNYGGRGIAVCIEWWDKEVFISWALANGWKRGLTIDRIDNNKGYFPGNCRFITAKEQAANRRSSSTALSLSWKNQETRSKRIEALSKATVKLWADPAYRTKQIRARAVS